jgi:hypothetical protein
VTGGNALNAQRKASKSGESTRPEDVARKGELTVDAAEVTGLRCVLCREVILPSDQMRVLASGRKQFPVHVDCLDRLHDLLHEAFETPLPTPTLTRSLTLGEFLLTKRPRTDAETLACVAYYYQAQTTQPVAFTATLLDEQLRYTGFKVRDFEAALKCAVDQFAYLQVCREDETTLHRLTAKGAHLVKHLPAAGD